MADGSGRTESDFLDAVEEASQSGPLPQPPEGSAAPRKADPTQLVASPSPRRRTLISPTRPLPKVAAPNEGKQGPVLGSKADRTTNEPSMLVRATASAVPARGARIDSGPEATAARGGTKASMPAPVIVQGTTEGSRPIRILSDDSKQIRITDAESRPIPIGTEDSKQIRVGRSDGVPTAVGREDSRQVRLGKAGRDDSSQIRVGTGRAGRDDSSQIRLGTKPPPVRRDDSKPVRLGNDAAKPTAVPRDDSKPFKVGFDDAKPSGDVTQARARVDARPTAIDDDDSGPTAVGRKAATLPPPARGSVTRPDGSAAKPKVADAPAAAPRSGVTVPDGSATFEPPKSRTQPSIGGQVQMIDAAVAAALVDAQAGQERVAATPGRIERDATAKGRTQVTPIVPLERPPASIEPAAIPRPAPIERTPAPMAVAPRSATASPLRKAWARVPNWAVAAAFGIIGLTAGIVIASGDDEDEAAVRADAPPSRVASATPTPPPAKAVEPPAKPVEPPVAPPPVVEVPPTETPEIVAMVDDTPQLLDDTASTSSTTEAAPRRRWRRRPQREPLQSTTPDPEPESDPEPPPPRPKPRPPSASALLGQARSALANGEYACAYRLAQRSNGVSPSSDAVATMARAACRRDDKDAALSALRQLPLLERAPVRRDCRKAGSRIGL